MRSAMLLKARYRKVVTYEEPLLGVARRPDRPRPRPRVPNGSVAEGSSFHHSGWTTSHLTQPLATLVATNQVGPGARVLVDVAEGEDKLHIRAQDTGGASPPAHPTVLLVDDNRDLLHFLERLMADAGWKLLTAESATQAKRLMQEHKPNAALLDYMLPDGNGVELGVEFLQSVPQMLVIVMTGTILPSEEEALCEEHNFPVLRKPFLASDVMNQIRSRLLPVSNSVRA